jgi:hypothetical protein
MSTLETDNPKIISALRDKYAFQFQVTSILRLTRIDVGMGRRDILELTVSLGLGFLSRIVKDLEEIGATDIEWEISLKSKNPLSPRLETLSIENTKRRPSINALRSVGLSLTVLLGQVKLLIMAGCIAALQHGKDDLHSRCPVSRERYSKPNLRVLQEVWNS